MGRYRLKEEMRKNKNISIRATESDVALLNMICKREGKSQARLIVEYIRSRKNG